MRHFHLLAALAMLCIAQPGAAQDAPPTGESAASSLAGEYVHSEMELVSGIILRSDGTFEYGLTVGSLDQHAQGRWTTTGSRIELTSDPKPIAPTIAPGPVVPSPDEPFSLRVVGPNGRDVPGVDFRIDFDEGDPLESYSSGGLWSVPTDELRAPRFVTFAMPSYNLQSERLPLDATPGTVATFILTPNDFGEVDLSGVVGDVEGDRLVLRRPEGAMEFRRRKPSETDPS